MPKTFTDRSNATRAAKRMLATGKAPATEFKIETAVDGLWAIVWSVPEKPRKQASNGEVKAAGGRRAAVQAAAEAGQLPTPPDFTADTHKPYRKRLAALVALAEAEDLAGLEAIEMLPARSTSPKALHRFRDLAVIALKARAGAVN